MSYDSLDDTQQHKLIHNQHWNLHPNYKPTEITINIIGQSELETYWNNSSQQETQIYRKIKNNKIIEIIDTNKSKGDTN